MPGLNNEVKSIRILSSGQEVSFEDLGEDIQIDFTGQTADPYNTVLKMEISGVPDVKSNMPQEHDGVIELPAVYGFIHNRGYGQQAELSDLTEEAHVINWVDPGARIEFMFSTEKAGDYLVWMEVAAGSEQTRFKI